MNPTIDLLMQRRSVRAYSDREVLATEKETILRAAMRAATAGNMMLYSIIEVEEQTLKDRLTVTCDNQPFIAKAPYVLLFCADYQRWYDYYLVAGVKALCDARDIPMRRPEEGDMMLACCDTLIAAQTAVTAAEALGMGACYIGDILERYEIHRELFQLPQYVLPVVLVCLGYPATDQEKRPLTPRFGEEFIVHQNRYHRLEADELERMFQKRNEKFRATLGRSELENVGQFNYLRKFSADFSVEMSRSVRAMIKAWTGNEDLSQET